jgi:hypothetical protein
MRRTYALLAATALGIGVMAATVGVGLAGTDEDEEAPIPTCQVSPAVADQGDDDVVVRGQKWDPESTVSIFFDEDNELTGEDDDVTTEDTEPGTDDDVAEDEDADDDSDDALAVDDVSSRGRFRTEIVVPDGAARGTHSINVVGVDQDGLPAHCARTLRLNDHPDADTTTDDTGPDGTTSTTEPDDTTSTTVGGGSTTTSSTTP